MSKPIIYLTFANQEDEHLPLLKEESGQIQRLLLPIEAKDFISLKREESAEIQDFIDFFATFPDQVAIFHFGGHAGHQLLQLEDQVAQSDGLAKLLGEQKNLQLVFLNGCSTKGQVNQLFDAGVKAVIATSVKIKDKMAVEFAKAFYQALANKRTIKRAFEFAKATIETTFSQSPTMDIHRDLLGSQTTADQKAEKMPWGLYVQKDNAEEVLSWRLPYYREIGLPKEMISYIGQQFQVNRYIVMVLDEMCRYNKDIYSQMVETIDGHEVKKDSSSYLDLVIQNFPWVIGSQIQLLRQKNKANKDRFYQLLSTFIVCAQTLYFILLSNFWDEKRRLGFELPKGFLNKFKIQKNELLHFDFLDKILALNHFLQQADAQFFIPEITSFCQELEDKNTHLAKASAYLNKLQSHYPNNDFNNLEKLCLTTEQAVAVFLQKTAFLADYRMLTVRDIYIDNPRYSEEVYELNLGALNAIVNTSLSLYEDHTKRRKASYSNCNSIVLTSNEKELKQALNLSPFIIDKNTFLNNDHIDLFMYGYEENGIHYYLAVKHSIFIAHQNHKNTDIIDTSMTLEDFQEGRNIHNQSEEDDFGFGDAFGFNDQEVSIIDSPKVFSILDSLFEQFYSDLTDAS